MFKSLVFLLLTICSHAQAGLINNTNYVTDTISGLDWLKLDQSINYSYDDIVNNQLGVTGDFSGWSIASLGTVHNLFDNAGGDGTYRSNNFTSTNAVMNNTLTNLFTITEGTNSWFHVVDSIPGGSTSGVILSTAGNVNQYVGGGYSISAAAYTFIGTALYRTTSNGNSNEVPEPSTLAIFAIGIMGLASRRFKKQS